MKIFHMFILACLLAGCVATATEVPSMPEPPTPTNTALPPATATSAPAPSMPVATKTIPKSIDPGLSVIQVNYSNTSGLSNATLSLVDPETGQILQAKGLLSDKMDPIATSPGRLLAAVQGSGEVCEPMAYGTACYSQADVLHLVDLTTLKEVTATLPANSWVNLATFNPDGTRLALADNQKQGSTLMLFDVENGSLLSSLNLSIRPTLITFRQSENQLVVYGQSLGSNPGVQKPGNPHVLLLDLPDLSIAWNKELTGILSGFWCETNCDGSIEQSSFASWFPVVVVAPDGNELYIAHADQERLTSVDLATRTVHVTNMQTAQSWLDQLLSLSTQVAFAKGNQNGTSMQGTISPNGQRLYLLAQSFHSTQGVDGNWTTDVSYSGLQAVDVKTGRILNQLETHATQIQISPDGDFLYLMNWDSPQAETQIVSTKDLKVVKTLIGWEVTLTRRLNGTPIAMVSQVDYSTNKEVGVLNLQSFSIDHPWKTGFDVQFLSIFPDNPSFVP
jgi:DNA-binding beta-propeller fold protein YncE